MSEVLMKFDKWSVIKGADGVIYCNCPGWRFNRKCKHLAQYHDSMSQVKAVTSIFQNLNALIEDQVKLLKDR